MGFFKSNKPPPAPLPNLALHLSHEQEKIFKPNDTVSGHIALDTPIPIIPQAVEVTLWGASSTWIRTSSTTSSDNSSTTNYTHYRDNAPLFAVTFNLFPNPHQLLTDQTYTFPFNFLVPEGTGFNRREWYKDANDSRWTTLPHQLPPTFFYGTRLDYPDNASISYGVTAKLICPGVGVGKYHDEPLSAIAPINFQPINPYANVPGPIGVVRYPKSFTMQSSALTGQEASSIGFRQRMHDRFSSGTPKLDFEVGIELPDLLTSGAEFRFRTTFTVLSKSDKVVTIPPIHFKVQKLELLDFTFFRASRDFEAMNTMSGDHYESKRHPAKPLTGFSGQEDTVSREKKTALNSLPPEIVVALEEVPAQDEKKEMMQAQQCEHWFAARVPGFTPPSFTSFAISRMYRIKMKLGVEIGDKKFAFEAESHIRHLGSA